MRGSPHSRTGAPPRGARLPGGQVTAPLCRGGYHPPVCPRNRWPRGARRLGAPSVGATCGRPPIEVAPSRGAPNGAPAATQRSGRRGERRPSGGNELSGLPGSERSAAWADDGAPISSQRNGGKEGPGGFAHPGPPNTGVHGGGGLYGQGKDRPCIAASFPGSFVTGAAAPRVARIGITRQALGVSALYQLGPPGRRWCHATEMPRWSWRPSVGATCGRPTRTEGAYFVTPPRSECCDRTARGGHPIGGRSPPDWSFQGVGAGRFGREETCRWHVLAQKQSRHSHLNP